MGFPQRQAKQASLHHLLRATVSFGRHGSWPRLWFPKSLQKRGRRGGRANTVPEQGYMARHQSLQASTALCRKPHSVISRVLPPFSSFPAAKSQGNKNPKLSERPVVLPVPYLVLSGTY